MILKHTNRFHDKEIVGHIFRTCCALHNILIHWDDHDDWEDDWGVEATYEFEILETLEIDTGDMDGQPISRTNRQAFSRSLLRPTAQRVAESADDPVHVSKEDTELFEDRRDRLIEHYCSWKQSNSQQLDE